MRPKRQTRTIVENVIPRQVSAIQSGVVSRRVAVVDYGGDDQNGWCLFTQRDDRGFESRRYRRWVTVGGEPFNYEADDPYYYIAGSADHVAHWMERADRFLARALGDHFVLGEPFGGP